MISPEYAKILASALSRRKQIKTFFAWIEKNRPKDFDRRCNELHEKVFAEIDCLKCANCCNTVGPLLLDKDIEKLAASQQMKPAAFAGAFLRVDEDNDYIFKKMPCPFLLADNCCSVYDSRPKACREFPHTQQNKLLGKLKITYENTFVCPGVSLIINEVIDSYT